MRVEVTEKRFVKMNIRVRNRNATTPRGTRSRWSVDTIELCWLPLPAARSSDEGSGPDLFEIYTHHGLNEAPNDTDTLLTLHVFPRVARNLFKRL